MAKPRSSERDRAAAWVAGAAGAVPAPSEETVAPPKVAEAPVEAIAPVPQPKAKAKPAEGKPVTRKPPERTPKVVRKVGLRTASAPRSEQHAAATTAAAAGAANALSAADWRSLVSAALTQSKRFPSGVARGGSPTLRVAIAVSGQVTAAAVIASSGAPEIDAAALQTVHRASPLPPPPAGRQTLTFRMNFRPR